MSKLNEDGMGTIPENTNDNSNAMGSGDDVNWDLSMMRIENIDMEMWKGRSHT
jgi:hypothetical protein